MIILLWPPATLSGHAKGNGQWRKVKDTKNHREWARIATLQAGWHDIPEDGDIPIRIEFQPPDRRGDRQNFPGRIKASLDGVADALKINDKRFLPAYFFGPVYPGGRVIITIGEPDNINEK